ncbi:MAG TPA: hypothetical protein VLP30_01895, partial [Desulfatirhabdiaceae bacterium]|nr:hypothetical protein [Desulfatirhabdiaceae bacterium]
GWPQKAYPLPAALRNEFSEDLYIVGYSDVIFKQASSSILKSVQMVYTAGNSISYLILQNKHVMDVNLTAYVE